MRSYLRPLIAVAAIVAIVGCGDDGPEENGPFLVNFEQFFPDTGFTLVAMPFDLGHGITVEGTTPADDFFIFSTADGWGLGDCDGVAHAGSFLAGFNGFPVVGEISFDSPVSRVELWVGNVDSSLVTVTAYDAQDQIVDIAARYSYCPILGSGDLLRLTAESNVITRIEIDGEYPVFDDLAYFRRP